MQFSKIIELLLETYNSIDIRIAAFVQDDKWKSAVTVLRFRQESVEELNEHYSNLIEKIGYVKTDHYNQFLKAFSIKEWKTIENDWKNKLIKMSSATTIYLENSDELSRDLTIPYTHSYDQIFHDWNTFSVVEPAYREEIFSKLRQCDSNANKQGYRDVIDHLSDLFEITKSEIRNQGVNMITVPMFFKINNVKFSDSNIILSCQGDKRDVSISVSFNETNDAGMPKKLNDKIFISYKNTMVSTIENYNITTKLKKTYLDDHFSITVNYKDLIICETTGLVKYHTTKISNSFLETFEKFVPFDELRKIIFEYEGKGTKNKKDIFEMGISWILSLLGLNSIWLGYKYDTIGSEPNSISVDILSKFDDETILLVAITTGTPPDSDFTRMKIYRENLLKIISDPHVKLKSILFSGQTLKGLESLANKTNVVLFGKEELEEIIRNLEKGDIKNAKKIMTREFMSNLLP